MTTIFTRIIQGEIPGTFVYKDEACVAFMSINPMADGHVLVIPRRSRSLGGFVSVHRITPF